MVSANAATSTEKNLDMVGGLWTGIGIVAQMTMPRRMKFRPVARALAAWRSRFLAHGGGRAGEMWR
ncbi:hypothetical protein GCM10009080_48260 [Cupriavidus pauculus]